MSSTASTGQCFKVATALHAVLISGKSIKAVALNGSSGTVRYVISEMNPRVPSDPIIRWAMMSIGSVKYTKALRL